MNARTENQKPVRWISLYNFAVKQSSDFHFQNSKTFFGKTFKTFSCETSGNRLRAKRTLDQSDSFRLERGHSVAPCRRFVLNAYFKTLMKICQSICNGYGINASPHRGWHNRCVTFNSYHVQQCLRVLTLEIGKKVQKKREKVPNNNFHFNCPIRLPPPDSNVLSWIQEAPDLRTFLCIVGKQ